MKQILTPITMALLCFLALDISAQKTQILQPQRLNVENNTTERNIEKTPKFSTTAVSIESQPNNQSLLQELYLIQDERNLIDKDKSLSSNERSNRINSNNSKYNNKKTEFVQFVNSKGVLNVSKNEQNYYLSILKNDNNDSEYNRVMELIKKSN